MDTPCGVVQGIVATSTQGILEASALSPGDCSCKCNLHGEISEKYEKYSGFLNSQKNHKAMITVRHWKKHRVVEKHLRYSSNHQNLQNSQSPEYQHHF